ELFAPNTTPASTRHQPSGEFAAVLNLRKLVKNYKETGALAEQCSVFSFIDDCCFLTKTGAVGAVIQLEGIDYECLDQDDVAPINSALSPPVMTTQHGSGVRPTENNWPS